jgi:hypothetical protein
VVIWLKMIDCLQQATADQAFTNAKAAADVNGMSFALIFRALERNTGSVGLASVPCVSIKAVNPEIAALQQHQDPAGDGAQVLNKQIASELAREIASVGGDPTLANEASTFAPGQIGDPTAAGNTCDDANDAAGCINSLKLRVDDLSADEITAAVASSAQVGANATSTADVAGLNATAVVDVSGAANSTAAALADGQKAAKDSKKAAKEAKKAEKAAKKAAEKKAKDEKKAAEKSVKGDKPAAGQDDKVAAPAADAPTPPPEKEAAGSGAASGAADFGSCTDPTIKFGIPSDGRKEDAFEASDLTAFPHGSALNSVVISGFICSQLPNACKANAAAVTLCDSAEKAASGLKGQAAADAFNSAIGF